MKNEQSFEIQLRDLCKSDHWTHTTVFYEDGHIYEIRDEWNLTHPLKFLSDHDRELVEKALIRNLEIDERYAV